MKKATLKIFQPRPLVLFALFFGAGAAAAKWVHPMVFLLPLLLAGILLFFGKVRQGFFYGAIALLALSAGILRGSAGLYPDYGYTSQQRVEAKGIVMQNAYPNEEGITELYLNDVTTSAGRLDKNLVLTVHQSQSIRAGTEVAFEGRISIPKAASAFGEFDRRVYLLAEGIGYQSSASRISIGADKRPTAYLPQRIAWSMAEAIDQMYGEQAGMVKGMILGEKSGISALEEQYSRTAGISHILAISGLHVGYVLLAFHFLATLFKLKGVPRLLLVCGLLWGYCFMVGLPPSCVRACIMASCALAGNALGKKVDLLSSIGVSAVVVLLINPAQVFHVGFQLSYGAVLGIALCYRPVFLGLRRIRIPKGIAETIAVSVSAQIGTLPIGAMAFGRISTLALLTNIVVVPLAGLVVLGGLVSVMGYWIFPLLGQAVAYGVQSLVMCIQVISEKIALVRFSEIRIQNFPYSLAAGWYNMMVVSSPYFLWKGKHKKRVIYGIVLLCAAAVTVELGLGGSLNWIINSFKMK